jgi:hypothetical protein
MKTQYSIIYIKPNVLTAEKLAVGMIIFTKDKIWFDFESSKIDIVDKLHPSGSLKAHLSTSLKGMKSYIQEINMQSNDSKACLFAHKAIFSEVTYAKYLNNYSAGLIHFGEPTPIASAVDNKMFFSLFDKFIGVKESKDIKKNSFHQDFKKKLSSVDLKDKVDIDYKITPNKIDGIYSNTQVRLIGKNGVVTAIQDIDFTNSLETIGNQLNQWEVLANALNKLSTEKNWPENGEYNIVFNKPEKKSNQEKLLNKIYKQDKRFKLIEINEVDKLLFKIQENDYKPLSTLI